MSSENIRLLPAINISLFRLLPDFYDFDACDYELARMYFSTQTGATLKDREILLYIIMNYKENNNTFPSIKEIEENFCRLSCLCEYNYPEQKVIEMKKHLLYKYGRKPKNCVEVENLMEYELLNKRFPSEEELIEYTNNRLRFNYDPEEYYKEDKVEKPAKNFSEAMVKYPIEEIKENCSICFEEIKNKPYYQISCTHMFHANKEDCLGEASIVDWFKKNDYCPNCKHTI